MLPIIESGHITSTMANTHITAVMTGSPILDLVIGLSNDRPVFHSESDLQFELGVRLRAAYGNIRFEVPPAVFGAIRVGNEKLDLWLPDFRLGIELKYERSWNRGKSSRANAEGLVTCNDECFRFPGAIASKTIPGFIRDVERLTRWVGSGIDHGYAIMITNNPDIWQSNALVNQLSELATTKLTLNAEQAFTNLWTDYSE